jgi:hypothetical protein
MILKNFKLFVLIEIWIYFISKGLWAGMSQALAPSKRAVVAAGFFSWDSHDPAAIGSVPRFRGMLTKCTHVPRKR